MNPVDLVMLGFRSELEKISAPPSLLALADQLDLPGIDAMGTAVHNRLRAAGMSAQDAAFQARAVRQLATRALRGASTPQAMAGAKAEVQKLLASVEQITPIHSNLKFNKRTGANVETFVPQQLPRGTSPVVAKMRSLVGLESSGTRVGGEPFVDQAKAMNKALSDPKHLDRQGREVGNAALRQKAMETAKTEFGVIRDANRVGGLREGGTAALDAAKRGFTALPGWGKVGVGLGALVGAKSLVTPEEKPAVRFEVG